MRHFLRFKILRVFKYAMSRASDPPLISKQGAGLLNQVQFWWGPPTKTYGIGISTYTLSCPELNYNTQFRSNAHTAVIPITNNGVDYYFNITATNVYGLTSNPAYFNRISAGMRPNNISTISVNVVSSFYAKVRWTTGPPLPNQQMIHSYVVYAVPALGGSAIRFASYETANSFDFIGYTSSYYFYVRAVGTGALYSSEAPSTAVYAMGIPPGPAGNITTTVTDPTTVTISWDDDGTATDYQFQVFPDDGSPPFFITPPIRTGKTATFPGCGGWPGYPNGPGYTIRVICINGGGSTSSDSAPIYFGATPPSSLTYVNVKASSFTLVWHGALGADSFRFSLDCGSTIVNNPWSPNPYGSSRVGSTIFTGLNVGSSFSGAVVYAINPGRTITTASRPPYSSFVLRPGEIADLVPSFISQSSFTLNWTGVQKASSIVYTNVQPTSTNGVLGPAVFTGLSTGTAYTVSLTPYDRMGPGNTASITVKTIADPVDPITQGVGTLSSLSISWTGTLGSDYYVPLVNGVYGSPVGNYLSSVVITDLTPDTLYNIAIVTYQNVWSTTYISTISNYITFRTAPAVPAPPTISSVDDVSFKMTWTMIPGTTYSYLLNGVLYSPAYSPQTVSSLTANTDYSMILQASNAGGTTGSSTVTVKTHPSAAKDLGASSIKVSSFVLTWTGAKGASTFMFSLDSGVTYTDAVWYPKPYNNATGGYAVFDGLESGKQFAGIIIYSLNSGGIASSVALSSLTLLPGPATNMTPSLISPSSFTLSWTGVMGAASLTYLGNVPPTYTNGVVGPAIYTGLAPGSYYSTIIITNNSPGSGFAASTLVKTTPAMPSTVSQTSGTWSTLNINWTAATGAEQYGYIFGTDYSGPIYNSSITSFTLSGLIANTTYSTAIVGYDIVWPETGLVGSTISNFVNLTTGPQFPIISVSYVSISTFVVSWTVISNCTYAITGSLVQSGITAPYTVSSLLANTTYNYTIIATNVYGVTPSSFSITTGPTQPRNLSHSNLTAFGYKISWTDGVAATSYTYYNGGTVITALTDNGVSGRNATFSGLSPNSSYTMVIAAVNANGINPSAPYTLKTGPGPTTNLVISGVNAYQFTVAWGGAEGVSSYTFHWGPNSITVNAATTPNPYTISSSVLSNTYYPVYVETTNSLANTSSAQTSFTSGPGAPTGLSIGYVTAYSFAVFWGGAGGASSLTFHYSGSTLTVNASSTPSPYYISSLTYNTTYNVWMEATNSISNTSSLTSLNQTTGPGPATGITIGSITYNSFTIAWGGAQAATSLTFNAGGISYTVPSSTPSPYTFTGVAQNSTYNVSVDSINYLATTSSQTVSVLTAPAAPNPTFVSATTSTFIIRWDSYSGVTYSYSCNGGSGSVTTPHTVTGLTAGRAYSYTLRASNASGTYSTLITASSAPEPATNITLLNATATTITIGWGGGGGASTTVIYVDGNPVISLPGGTNTCTIPGLTSGTPYVIYIVTTDSAGQSTTSNTVTFSTSAGGTVVFGATDNASSVTLAYSPDGLTKVQAAVLSPFAGRVTQITNNGKGMWIAGTDISSYSLNAWNPPLYTGNQRSWSAISGNGIHWFDNSTYNNNNSLIIGYISAYNNRFAYGNGYWMMFAGGAANGYAYRSDNALNWIRVENLPIAWANLNNQVTSVNFCNTVFVISAGGWDYQPGPPMLFYSADTLAWTQFSNISSVWYTSGGNNGGMIATVTASANNWVIGINLGAGQGGGQYQGNTPSFPMLYSQGGSFWTAISGGWSGLSGVSFNMLCIGSRFVSNGASAYSDDGINWCYRPGYQIGKPAYNGSNWFGGNRYSADVTSLNWSTISSIANGIPNLVGSTIGVNVAGTYDIIDPVTVPTPAYLFSTLVRTYTTIKIVFTGGIGATSFSFNYKPSLDESLSPNRTVEFTNLSAGTGYVFQINANNMYGTTSSTFTISTLPYTLTYIIGWQNAGLGMKYSLDGTSNWITAWGPNTVPNTQWAGGTIVYNGKMWLVGANGDASGTIFKCSYDGIKWLNVPVNNMNNTFFNRGYYGQDHFYEWRWTGLPLTVTMLAWNPNRQEWTCVPHGNGGTSLSNNDQRAFTYESFSFRSVDGINWYVVTAGVNTPLAQYGGTLTYANGAIYENYQNTIFWSLDGLSTVGTNGQSITLSGTGKVWATLGVGLNVNVSNKSWKNVPCISTSFWLIAGLGGQNGGAFNTTSTSPTNPAPIAYTFDNFSTVYSVTNAPAYGNPVFPLYGTAGYWGINNICTEAAEYFSTTTTKPLFLAIAQYAQSYRTTTAPAASDSYPVELIHSTDGFNWSTNRALGGNIHTISIYNTAGLTNLCWAGDHFIIECNNPYAYATSPNGITWTLNLELMSTLSTGLTNSNPTKNIWNFANNIPRIEAVTNVTQTFASKSSFTISWTNPGNIVASSYSFYLNSTLTVPVESTIISSATFIGFSTYTGFFQNIISSGVVIGSTSYLSTFSTYVYNHDNITQTFNKSYLFMGYLLPSTIQDSGLSCALSTNAIKFMWSGGMGVTGYTYYLNGTQVYPDCDFGLVNNTAICSGLLYNTSYTLRVIGSNPGGSYSTVLTCVSGPNKYPAPISGLVVSCVNSYSFLLKWSGGGDPPAALNAVSSLSYVIRSGFTNSQNYTKTTFSTIDYGLTDQTALVFNFQNSYSNTNYKPNPIPNTLNSYNLYLMAQVSGLNSYGNTTVTNPVHATVGLVQPLIVSTQRFTTTSFAIKWFGTNMNQPIYTPFSSFTYTLNGVTTTPSYISTGQENPGFGYSVSSYYALFTGLTPATKYYTIVTGYASSGKAFSNTLDAATAPGQPTNINVTMQTLSSFSISWSGGTGAESYSFFLNNAQVNPGTFSVANKTATFINLASGMNYIVMVRAILGSAYTDSDFWTPYLISTLGSNTVKVTTWVSGDDPFLINGYFGSTIGSPMSQWQSRIIRNDLYTVGNPATYFNDGKYFCYKFLGYNPYYMTGTWGPTPTFFIVEQNLGSTANGNNLIWNSNDPSNGLQIGYGVSSMVWSYYRAATPAFSTIYTFSTQMGVTRLWTFSMMISTNSLGQNYYVNTMYLNGQQITSTISTPYMFSNNYNQHYLGNGYQGNMYEFIVASDISTSTRQSTEGYLAWKYGLQDSLPTNHPCYGSNINSYASTISTTTLSLAPVMILNINVPTSGRNFQIYYPPSNQFTAYSAAIYYSNGVLWNTYTGYTGTQGTGGMNLNVPSDYPCTFIISLIGLNVNGNYYSTTMTNVSFCLTQGVIPATNLRISNTSATTFTAVWSTFAPYVNYNYTLYDTNTDAVTTVTNVATPLTVTGLTPSHAYIFWLDAKDPLWFITNTDQTAILTRAT